MVSKPNYAAVWRGKATKSELSPRKRSAEPACDDENYKHQLKRQRVAEKLVVRSEKTYEIIGARPKRPIELMPPTSYAARKRRRIALSLKEVIAESAEEEETTRDYAAEFVAGSTALSTWGVPTSEPVQAVRNERRHKGLRGIGLSRGKNSAFVKFMYGRALTAEDFEDAAPFRFLDLPLEIRFKIYGHLLVQPKPIRISDDWENVLMYPLKDAAILQANKQLRLEGGQVLCEKNILHARVRSCRRRVQSDPQRGFFKKDFLPYIRNVVVECPETWNSSGRNLLIDEIGTCLRDLVLGEAFLDSLTLIVGPVLSSYNRDAPLPYELPDVAEKLPGHFKVPTSKIMRVIPRLRCKVLNIIIRLTYWKRIQVSLNLTGLPGNQDSSRWFAGDRVAILSSRKRARQAKMDLVGLEDKIKDIFEDFEKALKEGKAKLMNEDEMRRAFPC